MPAVDIFEPGEPVIYQAAGPPHGPAISAAAERAGEPALRPASERPCKPDRPGQPALGAPLVVLDTNVILGWLLFRDPRCAGLAFALESGRVQWTISAALRAELAHVLERGIPGWATDRPALLAACDRWAAVVADVPPGPRAPGWLRCTDASDQKFIDLAIEVGAAALLSHDRAVLKLARRARARGLQIVRPEQWAAAEGPATQP
jgi:predicted nucleic acid-binding protein